MVGDSAPHHWLSMSCLGHGGVGREQVHCFARGTHALHDLPFLEAVASKLRFIMITERWVESLHADVHRRLLPARHASALHVGFSGMLPVVEKQLNQHPESMRGFVEACASTRMPLDAITRLGLRQHPEVCRILAEESGSVDVVNKKRRADLVRIMYHVDPPSMYRALPLPSGTPASKNPACGLSVGHGRGLGRADGARGGGIAGEGCGGGSARGKGKGSGAGSSCDAEGGFGGDTSGGQSGTAVASAVEGMWDPLGGSLYDALWRKYALQHWRMLHTELVVGGKSVVYSIGPKMYPGNPFLSSVAAATNPSPVSSCPDSSVDQEFDIQEEVSGMLVSQAEGQSLREKRMRGGKDLDREDACKDVIFFRIVALNASAPRVAKGAPAIQDSTAIAIGLASVLELRRLVRKVRVSLDGASQGDDELAVLTAGALSVSDFLTLTCWADEHLHYAFSGVPLQCDQDDILQCLIPCLLPSGIGGASAFVRFDDEDPEGAKLQLLSVLQAQGLVSCTPSGNHTAWVITGAGRHKLVVSSLLGSPRKMLKPRENSSHADASIFELLVMLLRSGWSCCTWDADARLSLRKKGMRRPADYTLGGDRVWWLKPSQRTLSGFYLRALLSAAGGSGRCIPHMSSDDVYKAILENKAIPSKRARQGGFDIHDAGVMLHEQKRRRQEPGAQLRRRPDRTTRGSGSSSDFAREESSKACSSGSDSSGSSDTSSTESSSDSVVAPSPAGDVVRDDAGGASSSAPPVPAMIVPSMERMQERLRPGVLLEATQFWRGFKMTEIKQMGNVVGWEATCYIAEHRSGPACRKTLRFLPNGGRLATEKKLKQWCVFGFSVATREEHRDLPLTEPAEGWPTLDELDVYPIRDEAVDQPRQRVANG